MYKVDKDTKLTTGPSIISVGITPNVELKDIILSDDNRFIEFQYVDADGNTFNRREWAVDESRQNADKDMLSMLDRIKHISLCFIDIKDFSINEPDFPGFANALIKLLKGKYNGVKLRIKLVYNKRGFVDFPFRTPFVERINGDESILRITDKDVLVRPDVDKPKGEDNPIPKDSTPKKDGDLPF